MLQRIADDEADRTGPSRGDDTDDEVATTLRDVSAFMNDPVALLERALELVRRKPNELATWLLFGVLAGHLVSLQLAAGGFWTE